MIGCLGSELPFLGLYRAEQGRNGSGAGEQMPWRKQPGFSKTRPCVSLLVLPCHCPCRINGKLIGFCDWSTYVFIFSDAALPNSSQPSELPY